MAKTSPLSEKKEKRSHPEIKGLLFLASSCILLLSLLTFHIDLPSENCLGLIGWAIALSLHYLIGLSSYGLVLFLGVDRMAIPPR